MKSKYELLNNKEWLFEKYVQEKLSTLKIAKLVGAKVGNSVRQALLHFDIPIRNVSDGLTCNRQDDGFKINESVMAGCLLGDAGLIKWNRKSDASYPSFYKKNKFYDHIEYVGNILMGPKWRNRYAPEQRLINGVNHNYHRIDTLSHKELLSYYKTWYPESNDFKKVIPDNIVIDSVVLLHWFLDDGSTSYRKDRDSIVATLCTESFEEEQQVKLIQRINDLFDLDFKLKRCNFGTKWRIGIRSNKLKDFYHVIGECPIDSLSYKWKCPS